ncbi:Ankyrin repeat family protein isoform 1 [Hibiscus syriacus]|uniref:RING-type E3 ubiquitin transferase n=1 Tax=Hibiscus syriacus TaxID=106335 RepID=A0A6A3B2G8_HIBSY|nr:E3 ubiquitin-protein ligase ATL42-like [Hibiscus syriacus]KAE8710413.1 Ankyrin repeat family protein isoform 1 [Hibiscus syriacus]
MNRLTLITLVLFSLFFLVHAQSISNHHDDASSRDAVSNFQPSLAIVIGILCGMFALTLSLVACTRFCRLRGTTVHGSDHLPTSLRRTKSGFSGIDKRVIESLPFFRFSSLKGSKQGIECSVCLSRFEDIEVLRLLPECKHAFHVECIDEWLEKHSSCPLCRRKINANDPKTLTYSNSFRDLRNGSNSNMEPKEDHRRSSRFSIAASFRKILETAADTTDNDRDDDDDGRVFHKLNVFFKNRWSNLSSSDIILLNSEMISDMSSDILGEFKETKAIKNKEANGDFEIKIETDSAPVVPSTSRVVNQGGITVLTRFRDVVTRNRTSESSSLSDNYTNEETIRQQWLAIARRTIQLFSRR